MNGATWKRDYDSRIENSIRAHVRTECLGPYLYHQNLRYWIVVGYSEIAASSVGLAGLVMFVGQLELENENSWFPVPTEISC